MKRAGRNSYGLRFVLPRRLGAFPRATPVKAKTVVQNGGIRQRRWIDRGDKKVFEWDYENGRVEVYSMRGKHLGEYDAVDGSLLKPANPKRKIEV